MKDCESMKEKLNLDNIKLDFLSEDSKPKLKTKETYKINDC